jgi:hypothetical protein
MLKDLYDKIQREEGDAHNDYEDDFDVDDM